MCDSCDGFSRRDLLKVTAPGAAAFLAACQNPPQGADTIPDPLDDRLSENISGVKIDESKIKIPPPQPAQQTQYGEIMPRSAWTNSPLPRQRDPHGRRFADHHPPLRRPQSVPRRIRRRCRPPSPDRPAGAPAARHDRHRLPFRHRPHWPRVAVAWLEYQGEHVRPSKDGTRHNPHNIGVVMLGDFDFQAVTVNQRTACARSSARCAAPIHSARATSSCTANW